MLTVYKALKERATLVSKMLTVYELGYRLTGSDLFIGKTICPIKMKKKKKQISIHVYYNILYMYISTECSNLNKLRRANVYVLSL